MVSRLAFFGPLRTLGGGSNQLGVLEAPLGQITVVFANMVGASTLLAWDKVGSDPTEDTWELCPPIHLHLSQCVMVMLPPPWTPSLTCWIAPPARSPCKHSFRPLQ